MTGQWTHWDVEESAENSLTVWIDVQEQSQNVFSNEVMSELDRVLDHLETQSSVRAIIFRSRKESSFFAGADIHEFLDIQTAAEAEQVSERGQTVFKRIAALKPFTVAVIQGACLGGGLEMALACDRRIAVISSSTRLGLPEIELGILPGWGGTQRLPGLVGILQAISLILQAKKLTAEKALKVGLVDQAVMPEQLEDAVLKCVQSGGAIRAERPKTWMNWLLDRTNFGRDMVIARTGKRIARQKEHYPALEKALTAIRKSYESGDKGYRYEQEAIGQLLLTPTCRNLVRLFLLRERARSLETWDVSPAIRDQTPRTLVVLGGGTMGAGIAQIGIKSGLHVVVKEINDDAVEAAQKRITGIYDTLVERKSLTQSEADTHLGRLTLTTEWGPCKQGDVVIEAVPESLSLKQSIFKELAAMVPEQSVLATNTSALSVDEIFTDIPAGDRVGGLHFFNPVHRMDLIEVVHGTTTSPETTGRLLALSRKLGKTPIVTRDSPGFVVNRVLMPYLDEAVKIALEFTASSSDLAAIDQQMKRFGMPMGPHELMDQVGIDVAAHVASSMSVVFGKDSVTALVLQRMVDAKRLGRKTDAGFYNYVHGKKTEAVGLHPLVEGIDIDIPVSPETPLDEHLTPIQQRLVLAMINEAGRCLDEKVVEEAWMIDLAMVLGTGFAPFRGGPLQYAAQFSQDDLIKTLEAMAKVYGPRFEPSPALRTLES